MNDLQSDNSGKNAIKAYASSLIHKRECPYCHKVNEYTTQPLGVKVTYRCVHCGAKL